MNGDNPSIIEETPSWAVVRKPHGMPSAPLIEGESGTLVSWFTRARAVADSVIGRKAVERGLVHRLDTATGGLVLFAKTQRAYDALIVSQNADRIAKTYMAYCRQIASPRDELARAIIANSFPLTITSRFRAYGPGRKEVRPLFPLMRGYDKAGKDYSTVIECAETIAEGIYAVTCIIERGYRHQIRSHLSCLGFPILGDSLYGAPTSHPRLELHAVSISFPDPDSGSTVSVSLPRPDRMIP